MERLVRELQERRLRQQEKGETSLHIAAVLRETPVGKVNSSLVLSVGVNSRRQKRNMAEYWGTMHAECDAISKLPRHTDRRPLRVVLLVVRTTRNGSTASSQPCRECVFRIGRMAACRNIHVGQIWFTDKDGTLARTVHCDQLTPHVSYAFRHQR